MDNEGRSWQQVAAEAEVAPERAMVACYLTNLSRAGKSMDEAAALLRKERGEVRTYARDWGIRFVDYVANPQPLALTWEKVKRGRWELRLGDVLVAEAESDGRGQGAYEACKSGEDLTFFGSSAEIAIRRLSSDLERRALPIFGVDDIAIRMVTPDGSISYLAPEVEPRAKDLRRALAA